MMENCEYLYAPMHIHCLFPLMIVPPWPVALLYMIRDAGGVVDCGAREGVHHRCYWEGGGAGRARAGVYTEGEVPSLRWEVRGAV